MSINSVKDNENNKWKKKKNAKKPQTNKQTNKTCDWDKLLLLRHHKLLRQVWYY